MTSKGGRIECDFVVFGVGTVPNVELAEAAGIECDNGILVDATLRTSAPDVFVGGDVANHDHPLLGRMRVEHFDNPVKGATAARNMLGVEEVFDDVHWFWSDQYDANVQIAGFTPTYDEVVTRDARRAMPLIRAGVRPDPAALADQATDLRTLGA